MFDDLIKLVAIIVIAYLVFKLLGIFFSIFFQIVIMAVLIVAIIIIYKKFVKGEM